MHITCQIVSRSDGFAYRLNEVWSMPFSSIHTALSAARSAAIGLGSSVPKVKIVYQSADGVWQTEYIDPAKFRSSPIDYDVIKQFLKGAPL